MPRPRLKPATIHRITRMLLQGQPDVEIARVTGVSAASVGNVKRLMPVVVKPAPQQPPKPFARPRQIGERFDEGYQHLVRIMEPWHAMGDLHVEEDDDRHHEEA